jgi:hypothetical protein
MRRETTCFDTLPPFDSLAPWASGEAKDRCEGRASKKRIGIERDALRRIVRN